MFKMNVKAIKNTIRLKMKADLSKLSKENIIQQSNNITNQLINLIEFKQSTRIGLYLSMPEEVQTDELVVHVLNSGKECFIPRYNLSKMEMVKLKSLDDFKTLPVNKWNIRQPLQNDEREDAYLNGGLDIIVTPGLAFTTDGKRLGRGKGYYDRYLTQMKVFMENNGKNLLTVGIGFTEQIIRDIPTDENDFQLNKVVYKK